mgnify:FL=1
MSKKAWAIVIAVTAALTVFTFGAMWIVRPDSPTADYAEKVFESAKARQNEPLVSVAAPLKTNVEVLSEEDASARKVSAILASDDAFIEKLSSSILEDVKSEMDQWGDLYKKEISSSVENKGNEYISKADALLSQYEEDAKSYSNEKVKELTKYIDDEISNTETVLSSTIDSRAKENRGYIESTSNDMKYYSDSTIDELRKYIDSELINIKNYAESSVESASLRSEEYTDSKSQSMNAYIDSIVDDAKKYLDSLIKDAEDYLDQRFENFEKTETPSTSVIDIEREMPLLSSYVTVHAHRGYATFVFPQFVSRADIDSGIEKLFEQYPALENLVSFTSGKSLVVATYPDAIEEDDINYALDIIQSLLSSYVIEKKDDEKIEEVVLPNATTDDFHIEQDLVISSVSVKFDGYKDRALFYFDSQIDKEAIADWLSILIQSYPEETSLFDFSVDNGTIDITYDKEYTEDEVESYLDFLISFYSSYSASTSEIDEKDESGETSEPLNINKNFKLLGSDVVVDAYDGYATIDIGNKIDEEQIANAIVYICSKYGNACDDFDFAIDDENVDVFYSTGYTEDNLNFFIDSASSAIDEYIKTLEKENKEGEIQPLYLHREFDLYGEKILVDAYDGYATTIIPDSITKDDVLKAIDKIVEIYPEQSKDFSFSFANNDVDVSYSKGYTEEELDSFIDSASVAIRKYIDSLSEEEDMSSPSVPEPPKVFAENPRFTNPDENIDQKDIPDVRNAIRDIEIKKYLDLLE